MTEQVTVLAAVLCTTVWCGGYCITTVVSDSYVEYVFCLCAYLWCVPVIIFLQPPKLYEYLYTAFANDIQSKIEIKDFISVRTSIIIHYTPHDSYHIPLLFIAFFHFVTFLSL